MDLIKALNNEQLKENVPVINVGDTVRVSNKIKEGTRERVQLFEGTVIAKNGGGISETFTVRRVSYGVGVEKTFPVHSPNVEKVEIVRNGKVRRASSTICATESVRAPRSRNSFNSLTASSEPDTDSSPDFLRRGFSFICKTKKKTRVRHIGRASFMYR